jgi:hypothetical protein
MESSLVSTDDNEPRLQMVIPLADSDVPDINEDIDGEPETETRGFTLGIENELEKACACLLGFQGGSFSDTMEKIFIILCLDKVSFTSG